MALETTNPASSPISQAAWGLAVFDDLTALKNLVLQPPIAPSSGYSNATTSYTSVSGWTMSIPKARSSSLLNIFAGVSGYVGSLSGITTTGWAFTVDGTDYAAGTFTWNTAQDHRWLMIGASIPSLASGTKSVQVKAKSSASVTLNHDTNDRFVAVGWEGI